MGECPVNFVLVQGSCFRSCPINQQFVMLTENNQPRCQYGSDREKIVLLSPVSTVPARAAGTPQITVESLYSSAPSQYTAFSDENVRVDIAIFNILSQIRKQDRIDTAFRALQEAENTRDQHPDAYIRAKADYYHTLKTPDEYAEWWQSENRRVTTSEVDPEIDRYRTALQDVTNRMNIQQRTRDAVDSVQTGVLSLKDDIKYTTTMFNDQLENLKNQINIERRSREAPPEEVPWYDMFLNIAIVIALLVAAGTVIWKIRQRAYNQNAVSSRFNTPWLQ
jgi:hypothetical protein